MSGEDPLAQLRHGRELAAAGRHAEAADVFLACQAKLADDPAPWLNRAVSLLTLGDTAQALREASEACYRAPQRAETHYVYGQAWLAANQPRHAEEAFAAALRLQPRLAEAWVNLGVARYRQDNIEGAKAGEVADVGGIKIVGYTNVAGRVAASASSLYARNLFSFIETLVDKSTKALAVKWDDELVKATALTKDGAVIHPNFQPKA